MPIVPNLSYFVKTMKDRKKKTLKKTKNQDDIIFGEILSNGANSLISAEAMYAPSQ